MQLTTLNSNYLALNTTVSYLFDLQVPWKLFLIISVFTMIFIFSVFGNGIMIWIILSQKSMRNSTNYFLVNLSATNVLMAVTHIAPNVYYSINNTWIFGTTLCKLSQFITAFAVSVTVLTFIGMAADRFSVIMFPLRPRTSPIVILMSIILIWIIAIFSGVVGAVETNVVYNDNREICDFVGGPNWRINYDVSLLVLQYILPLLVLTITYIPISIRLWKSRAVGELNQSQREGMKAKRKIVKMLIAIIVIFAICWLPYQCFFIAIHVFKDLADNPILLIIFFIIYALAMSHCFTNPIIYCIMSKRFRKGFQSVLRWLPCVNWPNSQVEQTTLGNKITCDLASNCNQPLMKENNNIIVTTNITVV